MMGSIRTIILAGLVLALGPLVGCRGAGSEDRVDLRIIFVYNADGDLGSRVEGLAKKVFAPDRYECRLCVLTHDLTGERDEWAEFLESLPYPKEFLHRDEWRRQHPSRSEPLPAIFLDDGDGSVRALITSMDFDGLEDLSALQGLLLRRLGPEMETSGHAGRDSGQM
jgi:hypothetical protein